MVLFFIAVSTATVSFSQSADYVPYLDGSDLQRWEVPENNMWWALENGILTAKNDPDQQGSILWTKQSFVNCVIKLEFLMVKGRVDSGVFLRSENQQIQIGESGSLKKDMTGSIYVPGKSYPGIAAAAADVLKPEDWNSMKIEVKENNYVVWLNGVQVLEYEAAEARETGRMGLQLHPNREMEIQFKNVEIAHLPTTTMEQRIAKNRIQLIPNLDEQKVEVYIDKRLFTAYIYPSELEKPVLYPLISPKGSTLTRKFPMEKSVGERVDHPHHVGLWFNYGDVNGLDFWNNSNAIEETKKHKYGHIEHIRMHKIQSGSEKGVMEVEMAWRTHEGQQLLKEMTQFIFTAEDDLFSIDRITQLIATEDVHFKDSKEGLLGIRVTRALEHPSDEPLIFTDAQGNPETVEALNNEGVNGNYLNAEGIEGNAAWGKRSNWGKP